MDHLVPHYFTLLSCIAALAVPVVALVAMQGKTVRLASSLKAANARLQTANEEQRRRAVLDPLTQLANRPLFEDRVQHALARCRRLQSASRDREKSC